LTGKISVIRKIIRCERTKSIKIVCCERTISYLETGAFYQTELPQGVSVISAGEWMLGAMVQCKMQNVPPWREKMQNRTDLSERLLDFAAATGFEGITRVIILA